MPYDVVMEEKEEGYLRVEISGERVPGKEAEDIISVSAQVVQRCSQKGISRVLYVLELSGRLPASAVFEIMKFPESFSGSRSFKLAVVDRNPESRQDNLVTETMAFNRGYLLKVFADEKDATAWLLQS